jgi:GMP synthase (glutamine-hydrolysing)
MPARDFLDKLAGVETGAEENDHGNEFIRVFEDEASKLGDAEFLVQAPYIPTWSRAAQDRATIKSHHTWEGSRGYEVQAH